jgi:hypothetical protein
VTAKKQDDKNWNSMGQEGACMNSNVPDEHGHTRDLPAHDSITLDMKINCCDSLDRL